MAMSMLTTIIHWKVFKGTQHACEKHTLSLGWRVEKKHLAVQLLYIAGTSALPSECTSVQHGGTRGARAVTDGMSHWRLLRHPGPGSLQICRHSLSVLTAVYVILIWRNATQETWHWVSCFVTMMASDAILIDGWRTRKVPECGRQSQVWRSEWLGLWRADNLLIPVWVPAWLPEPNQRRGELCLISGHHYKCYCHKMWSTTPRHWEP